MINQLLLLIPVIVWLAVLTYYLFRSISHYRRLTKDAQQADLMKILDKILAESSFNKSEIKKLEENLEDQVKKSIYHIQKAGILRFNPFADTGGDQSFVLAILDGTDSGIVLTSLHSRGMTRWYAKNVKCGKGVDHELSGEELNAIKQAKLFKN